jgi:hypothetical protein
VTLCLDVRKREFNLAIDATWSNQSGVQGLDLVCGHDDLDVSTSVESVKLVEELQHGSLDLTFTTRCGLVPSTIKLSPRRHI